MTAMAGTLVARREVAEWVFSSLVYEPRVVLGWHAHPNAYLSFVGAGSYTERLGALTRHCGATTLLLHRAGERHANVFHDQAVRLLRVETTDARLLDVPSGAATSDGCRGEPA